MKSITVLVSAVLFLATPSSAELTTDRTITKVVKLLESMLESSKKEGASERDLFAKHKCYCDTNEAQKKTSIALTTEQIGLLENQIEDKQASTAELSKDVAKLKDDMEKNREDLKAANALRGKELKAFSELEKDLNESITAMSDAIKTLDEIGADQTLDVGADHTQYMAKSDSLLKLKTTVKHALVAASAFINTKQVASMQAFLQAPFTGTYTTQSSEVVGILKDMRDTFSSNLETAQAREAAAIEAHTKYTQAKDDEHKDMLASNKAKQDKLSTNDGDLATFRDQLKTAQKDLADDQQFLRELVDMCNAKAKQYEERTLLRSNEETAIAEAISILNSDAAFASFGKVKATKTGATSASYFFQRSSIQKHGVAQQDLQRERAKAFLRKASKGKEFPLLSRAMALLQANNPFAVVLAEIKKMIDLIADEEKADQEQFDWCVSERKTNNDNLGAKKKQITALEGSIQDLVDAIEKPVSGLQDMIAKAETDLEENIKSQKTETSDRADDNLAYQKNIESLVEAEQLLTKAIKVLKVYYEQVLKDAGATQLLALSASAKPAPPPTWGDTYKGQKSGGVDAIGMLEFILKNTKDEETQAHEEEKTAQHAFEDSMILLKKGQQGLLDSIAGLKLDLAKKQEELLGKRDDLSATTAEKEAIEAYLLKIKDGCDFIQDNLASRKNNRKDEKAALENAVTLLKQTPTYIAAVADQHREDLGVCADTCEDSGEQNVKCKACLAKVTIPAYCAGHAGTEGC